MNVEQERAELLPCPFCGGEAFMEEHPPHKHSDWLVKMGMPEYSAGSFTIECVACECGMIHESRDGVVAAWNRRAALHSQEREDAERFRWLTEDHADAETRTRCREILDRMTVMSYSAACVAIDHARRAEGEGE